MPPSNQNTDPDSGLPPADFLLPAIIDSSEDAIVSKNLHSIVTSWNKSAQRIFGYTAEEMIGQSIARLFPPDRMDEETHILSRIIAGERVEHFETIRVRKDGREIDVSLTISPVRGATGKIVGASKIARDITEQKDALRRLAQAHQDLKRADRLKIDFLATLSHELRTPLTAILGWIQILKEEATPTDLEQGLEVIERNVRLQSQLIEDLLDMSRIEAGKVSLDLQRIDLAAVVSSAMQTVSPTAEAKDIRLTSLFTDVDGVMGDKNRLQQIVWNLLNNAIKFTPTHGRIQVTIHRAKSNVEVTVSDNGQGIAPEFLDHVFDRFRQADASTTRKHGGLGIGLSIARHLAELHGGNLKVSSPGVGKGSSFTLSLPMLSAHHHTEPRGGEHPDATAETEPVVGHLQGVKVLAVDDDTDSRGAIERILERNGAAVRTASSMEEALNEFAQFSPDVVLSDIGMPGHDGYELIARLRALPGGRTVPAVALTALARSEDRTRVLRAGFQMHLAKPVESHELVAVVQNLAALRMPAN